MSCFFPLCDSNCRCKVPKEMSGHGKGRDKSIPKADRGIGKRVSQIVLKMSGHFSFLNAVIPERFSRCHAKRKKTHHLVFQRLIHL